MNIPTSKWIMILIYLIITLPASVFMAVAVTQILALIFSFIVYGSPIDITSIDFIKILKGSVGGGVIGAVGCWWIYYQRYRKSKNR
ncbi:MULTISPECIES: hypothetical protein [Leclercia]|uniref:hypothetical protein n=1 Tax=Leclercia TaxID=83654 RepID=UPI00254DA93A|nr:hypothetical protein [Leclercia adecarboxylata]